MENIKVTIREYTPNRVYLDFYNFSDRLKFIQHNFNHRADKISFDEDNGINIKSEDRSFQNTFTIYSLRVTSNQFIDPKDFRSYIAKLLTSYLTFDEIQFQNSKELHERQDEDSLSTLCWNIYFQVPESQYDLILNIPDYVSKDYDEDPIKVKPLSNIDYYHIFKLNCRTQKDLDKAHKALGYGNEDLIIKPYSSEATFKEYILFIKSSRFTSSSKIYIWVYNQLIKYFDPQRVLVNRT